MKQYLPNIKHHKAGGSFFPPTDLHPKLDLGMQGAVADQEGSTESRERIQKHSLGGAGDAPPPPPATNSTPVNAPAPAGPTPITVPAPGEQMDSRFIISDTATPRVGQLHQSTFLDRLNAEVCAATDEALAGTPFSSDACPYILRAFERHRHSSPAQLEAVLHRYDVRTRQVASATDLIAIIRTRTREAVTHWKNTGDLSQVPPEIAAGIPASARLMGGGGFLGGLFGSLLSGISAIGSGIASGMGSLISGIGGLFFKSREGGAKPTQSPAAVQSALGTGHSLDSHTRRRMEGAFGRNFGDVQVHTDAHSGKLSEDMNVRASTVGRHVAFGKGEYKPGTLVGDTLMAHELAHVEQQRGAGPRNVSGSNADYQHFERQADEQAALTSGQLYGWAPTGRPKLAPASTRGLKLQACGRSRAATTAPSAPDLPMFDNCSGEVLTELRTNNPRAKERLGRALDILRQDPTPQWVQDALWLFFRTNTPEHKQTIIDRLHAVYSGYDSMRFRCEAFADNPACGTRSASTYAYVCGSTNPVHVINEKLIEWRDDEEPRYGVDMLILHEAMHLFNAEVTDKGYYGEGCTPDISTSGDPASERLNSADSYACLVSILTHPNASGERAQDHREGLGARADQYRGAGLRIVRDSVFDEDTIDLQPDSLAALDEFGFKLETEGLRGLPPFHGFECSWTLFLGSGRGTPVALPDLYPPCRTLMGDEIIARIRSQRILVGALKCNVRLEVSEIRTYLFPSFLS